MQYPKVFNDNKSWLVSEVQPGTKVGEDSGFVSDAGQTNLIVNYLPTDMTENEMFDIFCKIGEVAKLKIVRNRHTGQSLGYGFVEFKSASAARIAQIMCNRQVIRGKSLKVAFARPRSEDIINANLYVSQLPYDVDEAKLSALFGCYGTIIDLKVLRCKLSGKSRGAGFVRFDQRLAAEVAQKALDNYVFKDATRPISVHFANGTIKRRFSFSSQDDATNRQIDPEYQNVMRVHKEYPFLRLIKREVEPEIEQTPQRSQEPYPFPPLVKRPMEYNIQQPTIQQDAVRTQAYHPYRWPFKRPMNSEIEQIAKRACVYVDPQKE